ncbi:Rhodanese- sulfurtransferase [Cladochytrium tenue]|nr:Rhodanese- sulfurtransferase [Cladochytrium tenue]
MAEDDKATTVAVVGAPAKLALPSTEVAKTYPVDFDLASLAAFDLAPFDSHARDGQELDDRLKTLARDNAQLLFNKIFSLPVTVTDDGVLAQLPPQTTLIPRAKPIPTGKPMTRWETFAKAKGIKKVKRSHKVYDETSGDYKPRYGFKAGASKDVPEDWIVEVPKSADPNEDVRAKAKEAKTERIEKNKRQQLRNQTESRKTLLAPSLSTASGSDVSRSQRKERLKTAFATSRVSTASMGKFDRTVEGEESVKIPRAKRKFESVAGDIEAEKGVAMKLAKFVEKKTAKDVINTSKASLSVRLEDFNNDLKLYNDYLEEVEDIMFNLINDVDVQATNEKIERFRQENKELIAANMSKQINEDKMITHRLKREREEKIKRKEAYIAQAMDEARAKEMEKESVINELVNSDMSAQDIIENFRKKQASAAEALPRVEVPSLSFDDEETSAPIVLDDQADFDAMDNLYKESILLSIAPSYNDPWTHGLNSNPQARGSGFLAHWTYSRAIFSAFAGAMDDV